MLEGIAQSKEKKISAIYKVNFSKELESFDCDKIKVPLEDSFQPHYIFLFLIL